MAKALRISRKALGPRLKNRATVYDRERYVGEDVFNLAFWILAGRSQTGGLAMVRYDADGNATHTAESWDPDSLVTPQVQKTATGIYLITYAAQYTDDEGQEGTLSLIGALPIVQGTEPNIVAVPELVNAHTIRIRSTTANTGAAKDAACLVLVF